MYGVYVYLNKNTITGLMKANPHKDRPNTVTLIAVLADTCVNELVGAFAVDTRTWGLIGALVKVVTNMFVRFGSDALDGVEAVATTAAELAVNL